MHGRKEREMPGMNGMLEQLKRAMHNCVGGNLCRYKLQEED